MKSPVRRIYINPVVKCCGGNRMWNESVGPGPKDPAKKCHFPFDYFKLSQNEWRKGRLEIGKCLKINALWW